MDHKYLPLFLIQISESLSPYLGPFQYAGTELPMPYTSLTNRVVVTFGLRAQSDEQTIENFALNFTGNFIKFQALKSECHD